MSKFLRKYQSWILVIGGALLMIAFLVPQALQGLGQDPASSTAFRLGDRKVTQRDRRDAAAKAKLIESRAPGVMRGLGIETKDDQWLLLSDRAKRGGFVGATSDGADPSFISLIVSSEVQNAYRAQYRELADYYLRQEGEKINELIKLRTDQLVAEMPGNFNGVPVGPTFTELRGIIRMLDSYVSLAKVSEPRLIDFARKQYDQAIISYLVVPVDEGRAAQRPEPAQADIDAHFAKYKDTMTGTGELGIGYTKPNRIAIQYLMIDRAVFNLITQVDPVEVQKRLLASQGQPNPPTREIVEAAVKKELIDRAVGEAQRAIKGEILLAVSKLGENAAERELPVDWFTNQPSLEKLGAAAAEKASAVLGVKVPPFIVRTREDLLTASDLSTVVGLGGANFRVGTKQIPVADVLFATRELKPSKPAPIYTRVNLPISEYAEDAAGNIYYMTITRVRPAGPPTGLPEVRDEVVANVKRLAAYDDLVAAAPKWVTSVTQLGFDDLETTLRQQQVLFRELRKDVTVTRASGVQDQQPEPATSSPAFVEAVASRAEKVDPTQFLERSNPNAVFFVPAPAQQAIVLVQITAVEPVTTERFRQMADGLMAQMISRSTQPTLASVFSYGALAKQMNLKVEKSDEPE